MQVKVSRIPQARIELQPDVWVINDLSLEKNQRVLGYDGLELGNWKLVNEVLQRCEGAPLVVNVGVQDGYYGFAAATYGCRVMMFEPQLGCIPDLLFSSLLPYAHTPQLFHNFVNPAPVFAVETGLSCDGGAQYAPATMQHL
jgi:hypothetical protein